MMSNLLGRRGILAGVVAARTVSAYSCVRAERGIRGAVADVAPPRRRAGLASVHHHAARPEQRVRAALQAGPARKSEAIRLAAYKRDGTELGAWIHKFELPPLGPPAGPGASVCKQHGATHNNELNANQIS
ncbi:hypothetical protein evm_015435 [Chilo suppressalis]|nr:hypothetical protein evm_015435 [Chilo suppressalis]